jgi:hypothetical protein
VVANNAMNRERQLAGVNSYRRELGFGPLDASLPYRYLGADDQAGPGYAGQPSVTSYYADR